jgi:predicted RNase H-like nuclease (RuvC/YqgF family)
MLEQRKIESLRKLCTNQEEHIHKLEQENEELHKKLEVEQNLNTDVRKMMTELQEKCDAVDKEWEDVRSLQREYATYVAEIKALKKDAIKEMKKVVKDEKRKFFVHKD